MGSFTQFYFDGGFFMHLITVSILAAITCNVLARRSHARGDAPDPLLALADRLAWLCIAEGVMGALFGWFDLCAAMRNLPPEIDPAFAALRGLQLVPIPIAWALMVTVPTWTATGVLRVRAATTSAR